MNTALELTRLLLLGAVLPVAASLCAVSINDINLPGHQHSPSVMAYLLWLTSKVLLLCHGCLCLGVRRVGGRAGVSEPLPRPPEDLTPPPAAMLKWLHAIALHLDEALSSPALTQPCQMAADLEDRPLSAAACFQALLAQALHPESHQVRLHHLVCASLCAVVSAVL